ncbi:hypothetical protein C6B38_06920 [Spiroplasma sp. ChiS]|uniref:hypothetical protein n=1 Tax=Spiroplasma sp. ChiS TaxID=2099885 RepID=UPI000CF8B0C0|nr:hypothetical protein [Spiroplasma sp. ChiS]PQP78314.1 hypothetical protein C6B38_06920 [Spiroplasma sp. ChiS]
MNITESIKFNKLKEENELLKNEITELNKDLNWNLKTEEVLNKMMEDLIKINEALKAELAELKEQQLYYDKLPSKEEKLNNEEKLS